MKTPAFWDCPHSVWTKLLRPFGRIYAWGTAYRFKRVKPYQADIPVICVGNLSVGGTGKTPVVLALGEFLKKQKVKFFFLNHGYKSQLKGVVADLSVHTAVDIGDEAVLLALNAPTVVDNQRARGAQIAVKRGAKCILMDDGFQNPSLIKSFSFVVVDGKKGFGNEQVIPAGPLREPIQKGLQRADAVIIAGEDEWGVEFFLKRNQIDLPVLKGQFVAQEKALCGLKGQEVFAFAGIGNPNKFFDLLKNNGIIVKKSLPFPDHYYYTRFDIEQIMKEADGLPIVTTTKDAVKVPKELRKNIYVIDGKFVFETPDVVRDILKGLCE